MLMKKKRLLYFLLSGLLFTLGRVQAAEPEWYAQASKAGFCLQEDRELPVGHYSGKGIDLKTGPTYLSPRPGQMELSFAPGTVLEDVTFETAGTTFLNLRQCTLRRVAFKLGVKGTVNLEGCSLESCYVSFKNVTYGTAPQADSRWRMLMQRSVRPN